MKNNASSVCYAKLNVLCATNLLIQMRLTLALKMDPAKIKIQQQTKDCSDS